MTVDCCKIICIRALLVGKNDALTPRQCKRHIFVQFRRCIKMQIALRFPCETKSARRRHRHHFASRKKRRACCNNHANDERDACTHGPPVHCIQMARLGLSEVHLSCFGWLAGCLAGCLALALGQQPHPASRPALAAT